MIRVHLMRPELTPQIVSGYVLVTRDWEYYLEGMAGQFEFRLADWFMADDLAATTADPYYADVEHAEAHVVTDPQNQVSVYVWLDCSKLRPAGDTGPVSIWRKHTISGDRYFEAGGLDPGYDETWFERHPEAGTMVKRRILFSLPPVPQE